MISTLFAIVGFVVGALIYNHFICQSKHPGKHDKNKECS